MLVIGQIQMTVRDFQQRMVEAGSRNAPDTSGLGPIACDFAQYEVGSIACEYAWVLA
jgi:hypothetical protein